MTVTRIATDIKTLKKIKKAVRARAPVTVSRAVLAHSVELHTREARE